MASRNWYRNKYYSMRDIIIKGVWRYTKERCLGGGPPRWIVKDAKGSWVSKQCREVSPFRE